MPEKGGELMRRPDRAASCPAVRSLCKRMMALLAPGRVLFSVFLLALPIAYDTRDSSEVGYEFGAYGGTGQFAIITRGCNGEVLKEYRNTFDEFSGSGEVSIPSGEGDRVAIGLRAGRLHLKLAPEIRAYPYPIDTLEHRANFTYYNPYFSFERSKVGIGLGYVFGNVPIDPSNTDPGESMLRVSGHLRLGRVTAPGYLLLSVGENTPILAGGGLFNMGWGYPAGRNVSLFSGLTGGFYDRAGFLQQARIRLFRGVSIESSGRIGVAESITEGSISAGLVISFK